MRFVSNPRIQPRSFLRRTGAVGLLALLGGCASASGTVNVIAYGEEFIEEGIPADQVAGGWAIEFSRFAVTFSEITLGGTVLDGSVTVDLSEASNGEGQALGALELSTGDYSDSSFVIERVEVDGSASQGAEEKTFSWVFDTAARYDACEATTEVTAEEAATFQITVHADHLFYDSLVADEPQLRFQALADADVDANGEVTQEELEDADIGGYDPGSAGDIDDLWAFLSAQTITLGHVDGEGHCHATLVD